MNLLPTIMFSLYYSAASAASEMSRLYYYDLLRTQAPHEMGIYHISTTTHCILAKFAGYYVCIKRRLPTRLYPICITVTMTTRIIIFFIGVVLWEIP